MQTSTSLEAITSQKITPRVDQVADLAVYLGQHKVLNLSQPGVGKTISVAIKQWVMWNDYKVRTCWVMPKKLMYKNKIELLRCSNFEPSDIAIVDGTKEKVAEALRSEAKVFLMGPDRFERVWRYLPPDMMNFDVDEYHLCFGGPESNRTNAFYQFQKKTPFNVFMTGTLVNGRLDTAFSAIHAIEPRYYPLGYQSFMLDHALLDSYGKPYHWYNHDKLRKILLRHGIRRLFSDIHGHQEIVPQLEWVEPTTKQLKMYRELEQLATLELEHTMIQAANPGVNLIRCRQVLEHPERMPTPDGKFVDLMPGEEAGIYSALRIHFEDHVTNKEPLIVFSSLIPQQERIVEIAKEHGLRVGQIYSGQSPKVSNDIDLSFNKGDLDCIVTSPPLAGVGYNWQDCGAQEVNHVIFAGLPYVDGDFDQARRRAIRRNRKAPLRQTVLAYDLKVPRRQMQILRNKSKDAQLVDHTRDIIDFY